MMYGNLIYLCIAGLTDPIRPEVPSTIKKCREAGIMVRMITGDSKEASIEAAKKCGILDKDFDPRLP